MKDDWFLQAWLLSPRILHWTRYGLIWECRQGIWHESQKELKLAYSEYLSGSNGRFRFSTKDDPSYGRLMNARDIATTRSDDALRWQWPSVVNYCAEMKLTSPCGGLPALNGVARYLSEKHRVKYFAGIFSSCPERALVWKGEGRHQTGDLPTWSWASAKGVKFDPYDEIRGKCMVECVEHRRLPPVDQVPDLSCLSKRVLRLKGRSMSFTQHQVLKGSEPRVWEIKDCSPYKYKVDYIVHLDEETDTFPELDDVVFFILIEIYNPLDERLAFSNFKYKGLLLQRRKGETDWVYERKGFVESGIWDYNIPNSLNAGVRSSIVQLV
ncbi:hypothetical protein BO78DRAFT_425887 [Aspergillus sclerotiicarbonarius CBS 121057]|uniref:Uncharacterized protein n=1 Tax=Aspergillus sclerotiicarbonarius (strain CBS 121057 / IBT 28362) TaxID=1448318 RepID=A0A319EM25_ASPSB|nr:hypothetical protein BO78DRAFT_425887 [Aspergillus sclerotiicarbonarius CBS 121057]